MKKEIYEKIISKKEFSQLPKRDVEVAFGKFEKSDVSDEEKIRRTRELLHKVFGAFVSRKILSLKDKDADWVLRKHLSTRERLEYYGEVYERLLRRSGKEPTIFDLGAGINGFSYKYLKKVARNFYYIGVEAVGQLVELMNYHFKTRGIENCMALHLSLFEIDKLKKCMGQVKGNKIVFLFKALDSLEMLERDYSKKLLKEIVPLVDRVVVSFATRSLVRRTKFKVNRNWIVGFIEENFGLIDDFEIGGERYIVFGKEHKSL